MQKDCKKGDRKLSFILRCPYSLGSDLENVSLSNKLLGREKKKEISNFDSSIKAISDTLTFEALWRNPSGEFIKVSY